MSWSGVKTLKCQKYFYVCCQAPLARCLAVNGGTGISQPHFLNAEKMSHQPKRDSAANLRTKKL